MRIKTFLPVLAVFTLTFGLFSMAWTQKAEAQVGQGNNFGLGIALGSPSGLTGKYYLNDKNAIQGTVGLGFVDGNHFNVTVDYLYHFNLMGQSAFKLDAYAGFGAYLWKWFDNDNSNDNADKKMIGIGARIPLGLAFVFAKLPIDIYLEVAPSLTVVGRTGFGVSGALGFRYYF